MHYCSIIQMSLVCVYSIMSPFCSDAFISFLVHPVPFHVTPFHSLQVADDFSNYQLSKLMKRSRISQKLADVRHVLKSNETAVIGLGEESKVHEVEARRIMSSDSAHYILVKGRELESSSQDDSLSQSSMEFPVIEELEPDTEERGERGGEGADSEEHGELWTHREEAGVRMLQTAKEILHSEAVVSKRTFQSDVSAREPAKASGISSQESGTLRVPLEPTMSVAKVGTTEGTLRVPLEPTMSAAEVGTTDNGKPSCTSCTQIVSEGVPLSFERTAVTELLKDRGSVGEGTEKEGLSEREGGKQSGKVVQSIVTVASDQIFSEIAPPSSEISVTGLSEDRECSAGEGSKEEGRSEREGEEETRKAPQPVASNVIELSVEQESVVHLEEKDSVKADTHHSHTEKSCALGPDSAGETVNVDGASELAPYPLPVVDKESKASLSDVVGVVDSEEEGEGVTQINQSKFRMQDDEVGIISDSESGQSVRTSGVRLDCSVIVSQVSLSEPVESD